MRMFVIKNLNIVERIRFRPTSLHGEIPERPKGADCKSVIYDFGGSNPPLPIKTEPKLLVPFFTILK